MHWYRSSRSTDRGLAIGDIPEIVVMEGMRAHPWNYEQRLDKVFVNG
jgi:hypothetical protein